MWVLKKFWVRSTIEMYLRRFWKGHITKLWKENWHFWNMNHFYAKIDKGIRIPKVNFWILRLSKKRKCSTNIHVHTSYRFIFHKGLTIMNVHTSFTSIMPNSLLILQNWSSFKGLVKISASWLRVSTCSMHMSHLNAWSLMKWCIISIS